MEENLEKSSVWSSFKSGFAEIIEFLAIVGAIFVIGHFFVAEPHKVSGNSMLPNFQDGDYLITNKLYGRFAEFKLGDVVIFQNPRNKDQDFIKRIVGLPSARIKILNSQILVNGTILNEPYLSPGTKTQVESFLEEGEEITIPDNQYFVMGDNRGGSSDSRDFGPITKDLIVGLAWFRYWPPQAVELIRSP